MRQAENTKTPASPEWEAAEIERLRQYWAEGHSCRETAARLNLEFKNERTKMAVSGKVNRLGLEKRGVTTQVLNGKQVGKASSRKRRAANDPGAVIDPARLLGLGKVHIKKPRLLKGQTVEQGRPILDLGPNACRYALTAESPHLFCGRPARAGSSYCKAHQVRLTQPIPPTNEKDLKP